MPFKKSSPDSKGGINSLKYHKTIMNRIVNDVTLPANRRFLAEIIYMWISSYGHDREILESIILGGGFTKFMDTRGLRLNDDEDKNVTPETGKTITQVNANIADTLRLIGGE